MTAPRHASARRVAALVACFSLVSGACMFRSDDGDGGGRVSLGPDATESGFPSDPKPTRGGQLVYGLEAESSGGYCLPEAQLAISGMQVARAFYDPLVVPDDKGGYAPYLAKSIAHDADYTTWTITLRGGITFHDGSKLDATVVKNNLDAFRNAYPGRTSLLFAEVFKNVDRIDVVNELTLRIEMKAPWVAFPASLWGAGRVGMVAQKQLDASATECQKTPIGTGPFTFVSWKKDESLKGRRNPNYWQKAPDGKPYPYLDAVEFRPIANSDARVAALQQGEINMMHTSTASDMAGSLARLRDDGEINLLVSTDHTETNYLILNASGTKPANPLLAKVEGRRAIAQSIDRKKLNEATNGSYAPLASGPFAPGVLGHLDDAGAPAYDLAAAKAAVAKLKAQGADLTIRLLTSTGPGAVQASGMEKEMIEAAGFTVILDVTDESKLIGEVIAGNFDIATFRNQPGDDPDANAYWWRGGKNLLNFGRFDDAVIDENLRIGQTQSDPDVRRKAYEAINRRFAEQQYNVNLWWAPWAVAESANVHGILGPALPEGGGAAPGRIVSGHPLIGIWIDES